MSGTRFPRTGRVRFIIFFGIIIMMVLCVAMFQNTQTQLDETRELRIRCEQQQEGLNGQLQSIVEQKYSIEKDLEHERKDHMQAKSKLEQQLKDLEDELAKSKLQWRVQTEKVEHQNKLLQSKYDELEKSCAASKKQQMENVNGLEKKLQSLRSELQKEKNLQEKEINIWKEKYNVATKEKDRLEGIVSTEETKKQILKLESIIEEYRSNCDYKPKDEQQQQINSPIQAPQTTNQNNPQREERTRGIDKPDNAKDQQVSTNPEDRKARNFENPTNQTSTNQDRNAKPQANTQLNKDNNLNNNNKNANNDDTNIDSNNKNSGDGIFKFIEQASKLIKFNDKLLPFSLRNNHSLIINSVENFQIAQKPIKKLSEEQEEETQMKQQPKDNENEEAQQNEKAALAPPLSAPNKSLSSSTSTKTPMKALEANANLKQAPNSTSSGNKVSVASALSLVASSSSSALPPIAVPPPSNSQKKIPDNVAPIPANFDVLLNNEIKDAAEAGGNLDDVNAAIEDTRKMENDENKNNRYSNIVKDMEQKDKSNKDELAAAAAAGNGDSGAHEIKDQDEFNLPEAGGNDDANFFETENKDKDKNMDDNHDDDDEDPLKNHNQLLDADNLKNEVAGDQGKDFADGIHLDEGNEEEDEDDDYSNPGARPDGAQAIRN